jgi:hypothetical protein
MATFGRVITLLVGLQVGFLATSAWAEEESSAGDQPRAEFRPRFEITPYVGYRMGGQFDIDNDPPATDQSVDLDDTGDWGVDFGIYRDESSFYELLYSYQSAGLDTNDVALKGVDVSIQYLQFGGTLLFREYGHYVPWLSLTIGATKFDAGGGYGSETKFSGSLGGGVRFPLGEHFAATLGVRGYLTAVSSSTEFFCSGSGSLNCLFKSSGSTFFQGEALLGVTAAF